MIINLLFILFYFFPVHHSLQTIGSACNNITKTNFAISIAHSPIIKIITVAKEMTIEKNISIHKNISEVFDFLKQTKNQDKFSVWNMKDTNMKKTYSGIDGTKGFIYSWDSKDKSVGAGSQEITNISKESRLIMN